MYKDRGWHEGNKLDNGKGVGFHENRPKSHNYRDDYVNIGV